MSNISIVVKRPYSIAINPSTKTAKFLDGISVAIKGPIIWTATKIAK